MKCIVCRKHVKPLWNQDKKRFEPSSNYWKSSPPYYDDIVEVYCGPECSTTRYEERNGKNRISR